MDPISTSDLFVALLRQKLAERARAKGTPGKRAADARKTNETAGTPRSVTALAAQAGADDRHLTRTIVEQLLTDRLGNQLANEPRFQQIVEQVADIIADDPELGGLLADVMDEVREGS